jgi:peptidoglycan-associated lipoprotein
VLTRRQWLASRVWGQNRHGQHEAVGVHFGIERAGAVSRLFHAQAAAAGSAERSAAAARDVRADAQPVLAAQAAWLSKYPSVKVRIEGNADERGTREYNLALGGRRANSMKEFLTGHGVSADRIETISYGKEMPIDSGTSEEALAKNRNGHTAITAGAN